MPNRLEKLLQLLDKTPGDAFLLYAVALEHKTAGNPGEALAYLAKTLAADAGYLYAYYQQGQILEQAGDHRAADAAYVAGIAQARAKGDGKALGELTGALEVLRATM